MNKEIEDFIKYLQSPEGKKSSIKFFTEKEEEKQNLINFVGSEEFQKTYQIIYDWVKKNRRTISDTDIFYKFIHSIQLEKEEWSKFTNSISEKYREFKIMDEESSFPKYHYEYGALNIYFMHGQGTSCWIEYNLQNDREEKLEQILSCEKDIKK